MTPATSFHHNGNKSFLSWGTAGPQETPTEVCLVEDGAFRASKPYQFHVEHQGSETWIPSIHTRARDAVTGYSRTGLRKPGPHWKFLTGYFRRVCPML